MPKTSPRKRQSRPLPDDVYRVSGDYLAIPPIGAIIMRAARAVAYPGVDPEAIYRQLLAQRNDPGLCVLVGVENDHPKAVCVAMLPSSPLMMAPQVPLVYSEGRPVLIRRMAVRLREWIVENGYSHVLGMNFWRDDEVFMRAFRHIGAPSVVASLIDFKLED